MGSLFYVTPVVCHFLPGQPPAHMRDGVGAVGDKVCHIRWGVILPALPLKWNTVLFTLRTCVFLMILVAPSVCFAE
jgi:hypothetical protein